MFKLKDGYYIRRLDPLNWVIAKIEHRKKNPEMEFEAFKGHYATLAQAWAGYVETLGTAKAQTQEELMIAIEELKKLVTNEKITSLSNELYKQDKTIQGS